MKNNYYQLDKIKTTKISGEYLIILRSSSGQKITTIAIVNSENNIPSVNFSTEEIGKIIMKKYIDIRSLCSAIIAFHECQKI